MPVHDWTRVSPYVFHDFHTAWLNEITRILNRGVLPVDFLAALEQTSSSPHPNMTTWEDHSLLPRDFAGNVSHAVAVESNPPLVDTYGEIDSFHDRQKRVSIQQTSGEVVALIELVSPGNKRSTANLQTFADKIGAAISQGIHVLVLDILPPGRHDPNGMHGVICDRIGGDDFDLPADRPLTLASYEAGISIRTYVQTMSVGQPFRPMPLFLRRDWYVDVPLDSTYQAAWDGAPRQWRRMLTTESE